MEIRHHEAENSIDEVGDIAETPRLRAITKNRQRLAPQSLSDEGRHHATIVETHAGAVGVKNSDDVGIHPVVAMVGHRDRLGETLRLIVNAARSDGVHIAPVILGLRVNQGITVALGGGSEEERRAFVLRQPKGVVRAERADFQRRDRNPQIIDRARG